jgi:hypothetical protein
MANYMFVLRPIEKVHKAVCPACAKRGEVLDTCKTCGGSAVKKYRFTQYCVQDKPIQIVKVDRDTKTGILRYWENMSEFFYEAVTNDLNSYVPEVPYGVHFCHDTKESAEAECARVNKYLSEKMSTEKIEALSFEFSF